MKSRHLVLDGPRSLLGVCALAVLLCWTACQDDSPGPDPTKAPRVAGVWFAVFNGRSVEATLAEEGADSLRGTITVDVAGVPHALSIHTGVWNGADSLCFAGSDDLCSFLFSGHTVSADSLAGQASFLIKTAYLPRPAPCGFSRRQ